MALIFLELNVFINRYIIKKFHLFYIDQIVISWLVDDMVYTINFGLISNVIRPKKSIFEGLIYMFWKPIDLYQIVGIY